MCLKRRLKLSVLMPALWKMSVNEFQTDGPATQKARQTNRLGQYTAVWRDVDWQITDAVVTWRDVRDWQTVLGVTGIEALDHERGQASWRQAWTWLVQECRASIVPSGEVVTSHDQTCWCYYAHGQHHLTHVATCPLSLSAQMPRLRRISM